MAERDERPGHVRDLPLKDVIVWHAASAGDATVEACEKLAAESGRLVIGLSPGDTIDSLDVEEMKRVGWMPVAEYEAALRAVRQVDDAMVRRASEAMEDQVIRWRGHRDDIARAALLAALNPEPEEKP